MTARIRTQGLKAYTTLLKNRAQARERKEAIEKLKLLKQEQRQKDTDEGLGFTFQNSGFRAFGVLGITGFRSSGTCRPRGGGFRM